jgi:formylmethanofuran dehydrogenase subunit E-like metal-binding protein
LSTNQIQKKNEEEEEDTGMTRITCKFVRFNARQDLGLAVVFVFDKTGEIYDASSATFVHK